MQNAPSYATFSSILRSSPPLYAVLDGVLFDDISNRLRHSKLDGRSLFLDGAGKNIQDAGPWLVPLPTVAEVEAVLKMIADRQAGVFWSCDGPDEVIFKHLRTINKVMYPHTDEKGGAKEVRVLFRHYDPNALAPVVENFEPTQTNRLVGPANQIIFYARDYAGLYVIGIDKAEAPAGRGAIVIAPKQVEGISEARRSASCRRIARFLRHYAGDHVDHMDDHELVESIVRSDGRGRALGLTTERALGRWSYLEIRNGSDFHRSPRVVETLAGDRAAPDKSIAVLMRRQSQTDRAENVKHVLF